MKGHGEGLYQAIKLEMFYNVRILFTFSKAIQWAGLVSLPAHSGPLALCLTHPALEDPQTSHMHTCNQSACISH